jgi:hypothetical protein
MIWVAVAAWIAVAAALVARVLRPGGQEMVRTG